MFDDRSVAAGLSLQETVARVAVEFKIVTSMR